MARTSTKFGYVGAVQRIPGHRSQGGRGPIDHDVGDLIGEEIKRVQKDSQALEVFWAAIDAHHPHLAVMVEEARFDKNALRIYVRSSAAMFEIDRTLRSGMKAEIIAKTKQTVRSIRCYMR